MFDFFGRIPKPLTLLIAVGIMLLTGYIDYLVDPEISLRAFYLPPVIISAWYVGRRAGLAMAFACAVTWFLADIEDAPPRLFWAPYWNGALLSVYFGIIAQTVSTLKSAHEELKRKAVVDSLTGALNRHGLEERLEIELFRTSRGALPLSAAYVDLDNFKSMNDTFGHKKGDELLAFVAQAFLKRLRKTDIFARLGGDEFIAVLPETEPADAQRVITEVTQEIRQHAAQHQYLVSLSIGLAAFMRAPASIQEVIDTSDKLMYEVKHASKDALRLHIIDR